MADWRALLTDMNGFVVTRLPDVDLSDITETLNDIATTNVTVPFWSASAISRAASAIEEAEPLPLLEVQVWRDDNLMFWGPVVDDGADTSSFKLTCFDPAWWISRRFFGKLGNGLGGVGDRPDFLDNPDFSEGVDGLDAWQMLRTVSYGDIPTFDTPDPGVFEVVTSALMPDGASMLFATAPIGDENNTYQLYQDLEISPSPFRPLKIRFSGWVRIPPAGGYAPTNQRWGLSMSWMDFDTSVSSRPEAYYTEVFEQQFDTLDEDTPLDRLWLQHCEIEVPAGESIVILHVAINVPQGESLWGGLSLRGDDGVFYYDQDPAEIAKELVEHAMSATYGKDDRNVDAVFTPAGVDVTREYVYEDHANVLGAIHDLSQEGFYDWAVTYDTVTWTRNFNIYPPRRGSHKAGATCRLDQLGRGNVADIRRTRSWSNGANVVAAQDQGSYGIHEHMSRLVGYPAIEEVFTARREAKDYNLRPAANERLATISQPLTIEIDSLPGDERLIIGVATGDTIDVLSMKPGARFVGRVRIVQRHLHPANDTVTLVCNVEPA